MDNKARGLKSLGLRLCGFESRLPIKLILIKMKKEPFVAKKPKRVVFSVGADTIPSTRVSGCHAMGVDIGRDRYTVIQTADKSETKEHGTMIGLLGTGNVVRKVFNSIEDLLDFIEMMNYKAYVFETEEDATMWRYTNPADESA